MKLELLIKRPHRSIDRAYSISRDSTLSVFCLIAEDRKDLPNEDALSHLENSLKLDIWRGTKHKKRLDAPFLESCFEKWRHSLANGPWSALAEQLSAMIIVGPPFSGKKRELLVALWGNIALHSKARLDPTWNPVLPQSISSKAESHCAFYRIVNAHNTALLAVCPSPGSAMIDLNRALESHVERQQLPDKISQALPAMSSWVYCEGSVLFRWPLARFGKWGIDWIRKAVGKLLSLSLSRTKIAMICLGLTLSIVCTIALLIIADRGLHFVTPSRTLLSNALAKRDDASHQDERIDQSRFQPYASWISWLHAPPETTRALRSDPMGGKIGRYSPTDRRMAEAQRNTAPFSIESDLGLMNEQEPNPDLLDLDILHSQIQRDLANLHKHQITLSKFAERQARAKPTLESNARPLRWLEEEQKRSAQHLLIARKSLENITRRYSELPFLTPQTALPLKRVQEVKAKTPPVHSSALVIRWFRWRYLLSKSGWNGECGSSILDEYAPIDLFDIEPLTPPPFIQSWANAPSIRWNIATSAV